MRYLLSISPAEAAERVRYSLRGGFEDTYTPVWKSGTPQGFYGTVEDDSFEIGYYDGLVSPRRRNLLRPRLLGRLEETEGGCALHVSFWANPLLFVWYALFFIAIVMMLLHPDSESTGRLFQYFYAGMVVLLLTGFTAFFRSVYKRQFQELERIFTGVILQKEKD